MPGTDVTGFDLETSRRDGEPDKPTPCPGHLYIFAVQAHLPERMISQGHVCTDIAPGPVVHPPTHLFWGQDPVTYAQTRSLQPAVGAIEAVNVDRATYENTLKGLGAIGSRLWLALVHAYVRERGDTAAALQ